MSKLSTFNAEPDGWRFLTNLDRTKKPIVLQAIAETGQLVEWRDAPREPSCGADIVGSVWSREPGRDCSRFWAAFRRIEDEEKIRRPDDRTSASTPEDSRETTLNPAHVQHSE